MTELTPTELLEIQEESLNFVKENISLDGRKNWDTIYDLKLRVLTLEKQLQHAESKNNQGA